MKKLVIYITVLFSGIFYTAEAQEPWVVPTDEEKKLSPFLFNEEMKTEGLRIYENSCASCHGIPGTNNFAKLSPSPGDPASESFQSQSDGSMYFLGNCNWYMGSNCFCSNRFIENKEVKIIQHGS